MSNSFSKLKNTKDTVQVKLENCRHGVDIGFQFATLKKVLLFEIMSNL